MKKASYLTLTLLLAALIISCKPCKEGKRIPPSQLYECYEPTEWDSTKVHQAILGEWTRFYVVCYEGGGEVWDDSESQHIHFENDSVLSVIKEDTSTVTKYQLLRRTTGINIFKVKLEEPIVNVSGELYLCGDQLEFSDSPRDGCDVFYRKRAL